MPKIICFLLKAGLTMNDHKWKNRNNEKHGRVAEPVKGLGRFSTIHDVNLTLVSIVQSFVNVKWLCQGPRSKILSGGAQAWAPFFFWGGGGGGGGRSRGMLSWEN